MGDMVRLYTMVAEELRVTRPAIGQSTQIYILEPPNEASHIAFLRVAE